MFISKNYKDFFTKVYNQNLSPNQFSKMIEKELPAVCSELKIGQIQLSINLPQSFCEKELKIDKISFFKTNPDTAADPVSSDFVTFSKGIMRFYSYPVQGETWSDEEISDITFFHQQLYVLLSRTNMSKIIQKAQETDGLTGVLNTAGILHLGSIIFNRGLITKFSVVYMNIKKFKTINDIVTSKNGDYILKQYTNSIFHFLDKDGTIGRLGGDNFAIIVKTSRLGMLIKFLEDVRISVDVDGVKKTAIINVKAGVCQGNPNIPNFEAMLSYAFTAYKITKNSSSEDLLFYKQDMGTPKQKPVYM